LAMATIVNFRSDCDREHPTFYFLQGDKYYVLV
jgi:hypothetical protein